MALQLARVLLVMVLVCVAAALSTPSGRLPLALRGVYRIMRRDGTIAATKEGHDFPPVPRWRRLLAFLLVLLAAVLSLI